MKRVLFGLLVFALLPACEPMPTETKAAISDWRSGKADADCELPGTADAWLQDYCLAATHSDNFEGARPCIDHELKRHHGEECAMRREYKQDWCRIEVRHGGRSQSFAECIADPRAMGPTVKETQ